jgi:hypothetical protein
MRDGLRHVNHSARGAGMAPAIDDELHQQGAAVGLAPIGPAVPLFGSFASEPAEIA